MPRYDYECKPCRKVFEVEKSIKEFSDTAFCPKCWQDCPRYYGNLRVNIGLCDTSYNAGYCNGNQFANDAETGDYLRKVAAQHGVDTTGKVYRDALATYHGDPQAWTAGIDDSIAVCKRNGWTHKISGGVLECKKEIDLSINDLTQQNTGGF